MHGALLPHRWCARCWARLVGLLLLAAVLAMLQADLANLAERAAAPRRIAGLNCFARR
jgi:hypothetical protein